jgi:hypothetical protein
MNKWQTRQQETTMKRFRIFLAATLTLFTGAVLYAQSGNYDAAKAVGVDCAGNIYVSGVSGGDFVTVIYDPNGNQIGVARYDGESGVDQTQALSLGSCGNVYIAGWSKGSGYDFAVVRYSLPRKLDTLQYDNSDLNGFPIPSPAGSCQEWNVRMTPPAQACSVLAVVAAFAVRKSTPTGNDTLVITVRDTNAVMGYPIIGSETALIPSSLNLDVYEIKLDRPIAIARDFLVGLSLRGPSTDTLRIFVDNSNLPEADRSRLLCSNHNVPLVQQFGAPYMNLLIRVVLSSIVPVELTSFTASVSTHVPHPKNRV